MTPLDRPVVVLGGGGHARVVLDALSALGATILGFTDPAPEHPPPGAPHLGSDAALDGFDPAAVLLANGLGSVSDTARRGELFRRHAARGFGFATVIHPRATVSRRASLGEGAQVMAGAIVQTGASLGPNVLVNTGAIVDHDARIGADSHVAPGAVLGGGVSIGEGCHVGAGARVIQSVTVGPLSLVAAGAVVVRDCPAGSRVAGIPARPMRPRRTGEER